MAGAVAVVKVAEKQEQRGIGDAVAEDLVDGARGAVQREPVEPKDDEAQVAERGKGEQTPEVALGQGEACAVKDADDGESDEVRRSRAGLHREQADMETQHGIKAEFAGDDHGQSNRRFAERVGEPTVKRKHWNLNRESEEKREGAPAKRAGRQGAACNPVLNHVEVKASGLRVEP